MRASHASASGGVDVLEISIPTKEVNILKVKHTHLQGTILYFLTGLLRERASLRSGGQCDVGSRMRPTPNYKTCRKLFPTCLKKITEF